MSSSASNCLAGYRALAFRPPQGRHTSWPAQVKLYASAFGLRSTRGVQHEYHSKQTRLQQPNAGILSLARPRPLYLQHISKVETTPIARYASEASELHDEEIPTTPPFSAGP